MSLGGGEKKKLLLNDLIFSVKYEMSLNGEVEKGGAMGD